MDAQQEKDEKKIIKISVRNLVEFILREGDIDNRHGRTASPEAMWEGSRIHKRIQKSKGANYHAEVPLKIELSACHRGAGGRNRDYVRRGETA